MHLVLSVAAGVLATARFQQQQLQTLTPILTPAADGSSGGAVNKAASAVGVAHAPAGRTGSVGVRLPELTSAIVPPVEVRESSDPAVAAIWQEIHSQWKTYYETERSNMLARARALHAGSVGKSRISAQVHGSSMYVCTRLLPLPLRTRTPPYLRAHPTLCLAHGMTWPPTLQI
ncbi:hypothetical protein EON66_08215 [archaeon]|nr:MAG: hypothetical protein EON66_08215 [archaeon]